MFKWYVINIIFGYEKETIHLIKFMAKRNIARDLFKNFLVFKKEYSKKQNIKRNSSDGYIFVQVLPNILVFSIIRNTPYVIKILGIDYIPFQLYQNEILGFIEKAKSKKNTEAIETFFNIGEDVCIIDGMFKKFTGYIIEINKETLDIHRN